jgi:hypothetical protein
MDIGQAQRSHQKREVKGHIEAKRSMKVIYLVPDTRKKVK